MTALKPHRGTWAHGDQAHTPIDTAREPARGGPDDPGDCRAVERVFRDGHTQHRWAADPRPGFWGPDGNTRLVAATIDPASLPPVATWYPATNPPRPDHPRAVRSRLAPLRILAQIWSGWTSQPPPVELQAPTASPQAGRGTSLHLPPQPDHDELPLATETSNRGSLPGRLRQWAGAGGVAGLSADVRVWAGERSMEGGGRRSTR